MDGSAVVVDALPYIDHGYDEPGVRLVVDALPYIDHGYDEPGVRLAMFEN